MFAVSLVKSPLIHRSVPCRQLLMLFPVLPDVFNPLLCLLQVSAAPRAPRACLYHAGLPLVSPAQPTRPSPHYKRKVCFILCT